MKQSLFTILILLSFSCFGTATKVARIIDGDTFVTETGEKVRLIGINAPEITDIFGIEAKEHLSQIINQKTVDLLPDHISNDRDKYGRLLRYIVLNGVDVNKKMVLDGYAFAYLKYHFDKESEYKEAQLIARNQNEGIWNSNKGNVNHLNNGKIGILKYISTRGYILGCLIFVLIVFGIYYRFKK